MKFTIDRSVLMDPLVLVAGVVERRQTLPVLANVLLEVSDDLLTLVATDQEVELKAFVSGVATSEEGSGTLPGRKFVDIVRNLPEAAQVNIAIEGASAGINSGRFQSQLVSLPAAEFPLIHSEGTVAAFEISASALSHLIGQTSFAMAQQDVRHFFNGMLFEVSGSTLDAVATNGQRLAKSETDVTPLGSDADSARFILPRKGVLELQRLVSDIDKPVKLAFTRHHMVASTSRGNLTSQLVDATYPEYQRAYPAAANRRARCDRVLLKDALARTAILSNEMYRNVRLTFREGSLDITANNPQHESAIEQVELECQGEAVEIGFNVGYLIDVLSVMKGDEVEFRFGEASSAIVMTDDAAERALFVVSPMML